jgi:hypothetical protein
MASDEQACAIAEDGDGQLVDGNNQWTEARVLLPSQEM